MTRTVNVAEFKNNLSKYLETVEKGGEVVVCRRNVPVARFAGVPLRKNQMAKNFRRKEGFDPGVKILGDIEGPAMPEEDWHMLRDDHDPLA
ncbi:MAG: type II toxin-antitoxin system Phd/YefM family antitoxin [Opitutaceae bacterium]